MAPPPSDALLSHISKRAKKEIELRRTKTLDEFGLCDKYIGSIKFPKMFKPIINNAPQRDFDGLITPTKYEMSAHDALLIKWSY